MEAAMATNLALDTKLLEKAMKTGKIRTKKETVNQALKEFIKRREQKKILLIDHSRNDYIQAAKLKNICRRT